MPLRRARRAAADAAAPAPGYVIDVERGAPLICRLMPWRELFTPRVYDVMRAQREKSGKHAPLARTGPLPRHTRERYAHAIYARRRAGRAMMRAAQRAFRYPCDSAWRHIIYALCFAALRRYARFSPVITPC